MRLLVTRSNAAETWRADSLRAGSRTGVTLLVYGLGHLVVDAISAGILLTLWQGEMLASPEVGTYFLLYNLLAFGVQPLLGLVVDWSRQPRTAALFGSALVAVATALFGRWPLSAVVVAGVGNAIFHLGAGSICLQLKPGHAAAPGLFVAPGVLGLFLGTYLGQAGNFVAWPFVLGLAVLGVAMTRIPIPATVAVPPVAGWQWKWIGVALVLLLGCVSTRSLVGFSVVLPWKSGFALAVTLTVAVALGKALGGVMADRWGWGRIAVGGLALSTSLLAFVAHSPVAAIAGMFLFNLAMPVTLVATANLLPGRPAFAFGLTAMALELGAWTVQAGGDSDGFGQPWVVFGLILGAAVALYVALRTSFGRLPTLFANVHE
jgi:FSR family fosmidomycin resistance protein-like MFS transporter